MGTEWVVGRPFPAHVALHEEDGHFPATRIRFSERNVGRRQIWRSPNSPSMSRWAGARYGANDLCAQTHPSKFPSHAAGENSASTVLIPAAGENYCTGVQGYD
jgi:hypothetical protein